MNKSTDNFDAVRGIELHPLLSQDRDGNLKNPHYSKTGEKSAIEIFENDYTVNDMLAWCTLTSMKYAYRVDNKGQRESDLEKYVAFNRYGNKLETLKAIGYGEMLVSDAYDVLGIHYRYH